MRSQGAQTPRYGLHWQSTSDGAVDPGPVLLLSIYYGLGRREFAPLHLTQPPFTQPSATRWRLAGGEGVVVGEPPRSKKLVRLTSMHSTCSHSAQLPCSPVRQATSLVGYCVAARSTTPLPVSNAWIAAYTSCTVRALLDELMDDAAHWHIS